MPTLPLPTCIFKSVLSQSISSHLLGAPPPDLRGAMPAGAKFRSSPPIFLSLSPLRSVGSALLHSPNSCRILLSPPPCSYFERWVECNSSPSTLRVGRSNKQLNSCWAFCSGFAKGSPSNPILRIKLSPFSSPPPCPNNNAMVACPVFLAQCGGWKVVYNPGVWTQRQLSSSSA